MRRSRDDVCSRRSARIFGETSRSVPCIRDAV
jgi:hypothetical protein